MQGTLAAIGAVLISAALWPSYGNFGLPALALVTAGAAAALGALVAGRREAPGEAAPGAATRTRAVLLAGLALGLGAQVLEIPGSRLAPPRHPYFTSLAWVAVSLALTYLLGRIPAWLERLRFPALMACFLLMGATLILTGPLPGIDVWMFQQEGGRRLLQGVNPYELAFPNVYSHDRFYGPGVLVNGQVLVYPYPPLVAIMEAPAAALLGDVRWLLLGAMALAAWLIARLGAGRAGELAGLLVLFQPRGLHVLNLSWTEPLTLAAWAAALLAMARWRAAPPRGWAMAGLAAALLLGTKQYTPLLALPLLLAAPAGGRGRAVALALGALALVTVPFVAWNAAEFWRDVVTCQFNQPFRLDALSWLAGVARWTGVRLSTALGFGLAALALLGVGRRPALAHAATGAGLAFSLLLLFNKQAFCNYYWLAGGLLAAAAVVPVAPVKPAGTAAPAGEGA